MFFTSHSLSQIVVGTLLLSSTPAWAGKRRLPSSSDRSKYSMSHSYPANYAFSNSEGWEPVSVSDLPYKYSIRADPPPPPRFAFDPTRLLSKRASTRCDAQPQSEPQDEPVQIEQPANPKLQPQQYASNPKHSKPQPFAVPEDPSYQEPTYQEPATIPDSVPAPVPATSPETFDSPPQVDVVPTHDQGKGEDEDQRHGSHGLAIDVGSDLGSTFDNLEGIGKAEDVLITWYTGHDLENPSCWPNSKWAPTDESFACAVTLEGWVSKPDCFQFLELCNDSSNCIFVRVVDTCAGCKKGSKHVDLTKAAFSQLANLDTGKLTVKMRLASTPLEWFEDLWGPQE
ncbi:hypothetical protein FRB90_004306 [Tulasnella sp. 427]|nr:hypothetical protein FRB90_004306 [Tulasnella sp. 427]